MFCNINWCQGYQRPPSRFRARDTCKPLANFFAQFFVAKPPNFRPPNPLTYPKKRPNLAFCEEENLARDNKNAIYAGNKFIYATRIENTPSFKQKLHTKLSFLSYFYSNRQCRLIYRRIFGAQVAPNSRNYKPICSGHLSREEQQDGQITQTGVAT